MLNKEECPTKEEMARKILGVSFAIAAVAIFFFKFLQITADSIVLSYCDKNAIVLNEIQEITFESWIRNISLLMAMVLFVVLFLFLVGGEIAGMAESIRQKEAALREERDTMIRNLSHDIRTPLTSILSYSEYMQQKVSWTQTEREEYVALMVQKSRQIKELTDRLLDGNRNVEKIEDGRLLLEQLAEEWEFELEEEFSCNVDFAECPKFQAEMDVQEIRRIFDNLVSNIQKYADKNESIYLKFYEEKGYLTIEQTNQKRLDILNVESNKIGLESIAKIVEQYGGTITITEQEQKFCIRMKLFKLI